MEITSTSKGQLVIPLKIRRKFEIKEGTRYQIEVDEKNHQIILTPITKAYIQKQRGKFKGKGLLKELTEEKNHERKL